MVSTKASRRPWLALLACAGVAVMLNSRGSEGQPPPSAESAHVHLGPDGRLVYVPYPNGDTIPDFSNVGYGGGGVSLPDVPVRATVTPGEGDDGAAIQAAIDAVSALPPDASGFRGAVLLAAGTYEVADGVRISAGGVVLRGEGDGPGGTLIKAVGTARRTVITVSGVGNRAEVALTQQPLTQAYVPVGTRSFEVADASGYAVGEQVLVVRTPNQEWIDASGTDACSTVGTAYDTSDINNVTCISESHWTPSARIMRYERIVTAVQGNQVTVDAPLVEAIQAEFGGGYLAKYTFPGRIEQVGVERLRSESDFASDTDEQHAVRMISLANVQHAWVANVTSVYFEQGTVLVGGGSKYVTVQDSASLDHKSVITGGRRYPFSLDDCSYVLVMRCLARTGRHDYVTGSNTPGPNVFLDSKGLESRSELGPHHRWATGSLFDLIRHESVGRGQIMGAYNRGNSGSGHGWSGGYQLFWNCVGDTHRVATPPNARNWSIGCQTVRRQGDGEFESYGVPVVPSSLYLQQLRDRLGDAALNNIGYTGLPPLPPPPAPVPTPTPTPTPSPTPPAIIFEAETTPFLAPGLNPQPSPDPGASNRIWVSVGTRVPGDWIEYTLENVPRGTYDVVFKYKTNPNRGIHNLALDGTLLNGTLDQYRTGAGTFPEKNFGTVRFAEAGNHIVRLTVVDRRPASTSYNISADRIALVPDIQAPTIMIEGDITAEATGPEGATVTYTATATDNRDGDVPVTLTPPSGTTFALGDATVEAVAVDFAGNRAVKTFVVTVEDTTAPELLLPADLTVEATGPNGAVASFSATAHDLVSGEVPVTFSIPPGSTFPLGTTVVTATAVDGAENTATGTFNVSVVDTTPPQLHLPGPIVLEATGPGGAVATYTATAHDLVSGDVPVDLTPPSGTMFPLGVSTVTGSAFDAAHNVAFGVFTVTVRDTIAPVFTHVPGPVTITVCVQAPIGQAVAADATGVTVTNDAPAKFPLGRTTVTWTARDLVGNTATATQIVTAELGDDASCCPTGTNLVMGTAGRDVFIGTAGSDCILGRGEDDVINAFGGNDFISGGGGRDTIVCGLGDDVVFGREGDDIIDGGPGDDKIDGGPGRDTCAGATGTNTLVRCEVGSGGS